MQIDAILELCDCINNRLNNVVTTIDRNNAELRREKADIEASAKALKDEFNQKIQQQIKTDLGSLEEKLDKLNSELGKEKTGLLSESKSKSNLSEYSEKLKNYESNAEKLDFEKETLYEIINNINNLIKELNNISFDQLNPPMSIKTDDDKIIVTKGDSVSEVGCDAAKLSVADIDNKPADKLLLLLFIEINKAKKILRDIENTFKEIMDFSAYSHEVDVAKENWISEGTSQNDSKNNEVIFENLVKETSELNKTTFSNIELEGSEGEPDLQCGSDKFSTTITLGKLAIEVTDNPRYISLIKESPLLNPYLADGRLRIPFILNLKECGNIWLNIDEVKFEKDTFNFIHQVILQYLLAFPAGRLNLCLIDVDDVGDFSKYTKLNAINSRLLCDGIIRESRALNDVLMSMEKTMHDVYDNKLSFNDCEDFYQYNKISESNPQSATLLVLLNYPNGMKDDENQRLLKLMMNGNRSGIFTFVVNNSSIKLPVGINEENYEQMVSKLSNTAVVINKRDHEFTTTSSLKHIYDPTNGLSFEQIPEVIKLLIEKAKEGLHVVIPLEDMFANTNKQLEASTIQPVSEVIDIPIGKRGGEIQNILLDSTGEGSAHAVVIGGTGSGKSNLLHTIITSACYKYSPEDLHIYLVDFKGGVEFKFYEANKDVTKQLPHIKLTGLTSEPEDGVAILSNVRKELHRRENSFRQHSVEDIVQFRKKFPEEKLARLLVIIDEVQELFERDDKLGQEAIGILSELFKKGRAFGISILWASQNVPKVAGLRDKVLSQIGNRICLRLNNPDDASDIQIDPKKVKNLNRPEKGLGIISDIRTLTDNVEFRVAYAYNSEDRYESTAKINKKWESLISSGNVREPLFIVGNDDIPLASSPDTKFMTWNKEIIDAPESIVSYALNLGQDYITGKPFELSMGLRSSRDNLWLAGSDMGVIRDIIGYALLSVLIDNIKVGITAQNIYYINGEYKDPEDPRDLYYVLPELFRDSISELQSTDEFIEEIRKLYLMRRERAAKIQETHSPIFFFIHKLQSFVELFRSTERIPLNEPYIKASTKSSSGISTGTVPPAAFTKYSNEDPLSALMNHSFTSASTAGNKTASEMVSFGEMFKELFTRGADVGIHFVLSTDTPQSIKEFMNEFRDCRNKIILKGVAPATLTNVLETYKGINSVIKEGIAFSYVDGELTKFKPYRYASVENEEWLMEIRKNLLMRLTK